ncbi:MAG: DUF3127 domain-containing protein [Sediminibacterium sp.]
MSYELTGKLVAKMETMQRSETFKTREFVVEKSEDINGRTITNYIKFQCVQDKTSMPDRFNLGDEIKVFFNIKGSRWSRDGKEGYITNLDAWKMETIKMNNIVTPKDEGQYNDIPPASPTEKLDDLPF